MKIEDKLHLAVRQRMKKMDITVSLLCATPICENSKADIVRFKDILEDQVRWSRYGDGL